VEKIVQLLQLYTSKYLETKVFYTKTNASSVCELAKKILNLWAESMKLKYMHPKFMESTKCWDDALSSFAVRYGCLSWLCHHAPVKDM